MRSAAGFVIALVCSTVFAGAPAPRTLSFDDRVKAQTAIERVYYAHQVGATKKFEDAVPSAVVQAKVQKYLEQSAAVSVFWKTAVTDLTLQRELERMAQGTRMPERLQELYAALGNDPFLVKECLARPALVDRLTHNFQAFDATLHVKEKAQADALHAQLVSGALNPSADNPNRTVIELVATGNKAAPSPVEQPLQERLTPEEFKTRRADFPAQIGQVSIVKETRATFTMNVVLSETKTDLRVATYVVQKTTWDAWWTDARLKVRGGSVVAVASGAVDLPAPHQGRTMSPKGTCADDYWDNGSLDDVTPDVRSRHVAVWTGTQMIIWSGNQHQFTSLRSGGRYDPATDTWLPTSLTGAPQGRTDATAVWTGSQMVVWGGNSYYTAHDATNSGGRYDPVSDSWKPTSGRGAPAARVNHTAVWTGSRMVIWGGYVLDSTSRYVATSTGGQYDPATDSWTPTEVIGALTPRGGHTAVWTGSLMVIWGGGSYSNSGGRYDPVLDRWSSTDWVNAPTGRVQHSAVWTGTEMIVWGGYSYSYGSGSYVYMNTGGRYDPVSNSWTATSTVNAPTGRGKQTVVWTGSLMIVWGLGEYNYPNANAGARYDPASDTWSPTSLVNAPGPREEHTAVWTGSLMVIWGGEDISSFPPQTSNSGGRYDPVTDSWTSTASTVGPGIFGPPAVWSGNLMLVWGGSAGARFDPTIDTWSAMSPLGAPSSQFGATAVWAGTQMLVWGGSTYTNEYPDSGRRYDPVSDSWSPMSETNAPVGRQAHTAIWTGHSMVIWGGYNSDPTHYEFDLDSGGRYDPTTDLWTPTSQLGAPSARAQHTAVWTGSSMVVWGGEIGSVYPQVIVNTGGRYDPTTDTWSPTDTTNAPYGRIGHTAVWTGNFMIVWGGQNDNYLHGTGGRYDPASDVWTTVSTTVAPGGRSRHTAIWTGRLMVIWGGTGPQFYLNGNGGRYDPIADGWSPISKAAEPELRANHTAVWTGTSMIVWGGQESGSNLGGGQYFPGTIMDNDCDGDGITGYAGDCDDHNASVYPGAPQICDGINDDCNDPNWPYLNPYESTEVDSDGDGFLACRDDCDDLNPAVYPGAPQLCDGVNNDCNDPAWPAVPADEADADHDGARVCDGDCDDTDSSVRPGYTDYCDGRDNDCNGTIDDGPATAFCDDYNPCTDDVCGGVAGCLHRANHNPCDDRNQCTSNDVCGGGVCAGTPTPGAACDDGNGCTSDDHCDIRNVCVGASGCDDGDPCTIDYPDPSNLCACTHVPSRGSCDDGNPCTTGEYCHQVDYGGPLICGFGWPTICDDGSPCTDDSCTPSVGCVHSPHDGGACSDGDPCTDGDTCQGGVCVGLTPIDCNAECPAGSTPADGGCSLTYDIAQDALDNLAYSCDQDGLHRHNDCYLAYGFHWTDAGRAIGPVIRVDLTLALGSDCSNAPGSVILNGSVVGGFVHGGNCDCFAYKPTITLTANSVDSYSTSGVNQIFLSPTRNGCDGLDANDDIGGHFARVTVTYQRANSCEVGTCDRNAGGCTYPSRPDGIACTDGNVCTVDDSCGSGSCGGSPISGTSCDDGDACTGNDSCSLGVCGGTPLSGNACDDGNACTTSDTCVSGTCVGTALNCDDSNVCTDDSCSPSRGCVHVNKLFGSCDDGDPCTVDDVCAGGFCYPGSRLDCNDGDPCTNDSCAAGTCIHVNSCDDGNPCTTDICGQFGCSHTNNTNPCDDGNPCTSADTCGGGTCQSGPPSDCDDGDPCTQDSCNPAGGCVHASLTGPCDDGNSCTTGETCVTGTCGGGVPVVCNDSNPCTTDTCNPYVGCIYAPNNEPCDDGSACTAGDHCIGGACHGASIDCNDGNPCTDDSCNPGTGCIHPNNIRLCSDGNACTVGDRCSGGACLGTPVNCDDHNVCTTDSCDTSTGCIHIANTNACDDGNACTTDDVCAPKVYFAEKFDAVTAPALPVGWSSVVVGTGATWVTRTAGSDTAPNSAFGVDNDRLADEVLETPAIAIASTTVRLTFRNRWSFDDAENCFDAGVLEIKIGAGSYADIVAAGGSFISGGYTGVVSPYYNNPLAQRDAWCSTSSGYPEYLTTAVNLPAAAAGQTIRLRWRLGSDSSGSAVGQEIDSIVISDAVVTCTGGPAPDCNDNNLCTDDSCNPATGCVHTNNTNPCSDSNACTSGDICGGGSCHGNALNCDDGNPCTDDSCNPATGCVHANNTNSCGGGNACTTGGVCGGGTCNPGTPLICNDNNPCTTDTCNPATGCVYTNNTYSCSDGNACTSGDTCSGGTCHAGTPVICAPADACHSAGVCNPSTGACSSVNAPDGTACSDNNLCTAGDSCRAGICTPASNGLNHPRPKSAGYYKQLCDRGRAHDHTVYHGDLLTDADAQCVAGLTATFDYLQTVDDICNVLDDDNGQGWHGGRHHGGNGNGPNGHDCDKAEDELIATALNICRARVCLAQDLDSHCHGNTHTTVGQSFADGDAILDNALRDQHTCNAARCELREINNGHALEMNSLVLSIENGKVRLTWGLPVMDDGAATPSSYELWRRPMGSGDNFTEIGQTTSLSFVDGTAGTAVWEYDVSTVMP